MNVWFDAEGGHPTESELADLVLGELDDAARATVADHLRSCLTCRQLADRLSGGLADPLDGEAVFDQLGDTAAAPPAVVAAVAGADRPDRGPQVGDLWRARPRAGGEAMLVRIQAVRPTAAAVVPVTFDTELADEHTRIVAVDDSPLGLPLALHLDLEADIDRDTLLDRLGALDDAGDAGAVIVGPRVVSALDERIAYRQGLADRLALLAPAGAGEPDTAVEDGWWPVDAPSASFELLQAVHEALAESHPAARVLPSPRGPGAAPLVRAIAQVAELDAFVLVAALDERAADMSVLEAARQVLDGDQLLNAVCVVEPVAPFLSVVVDRHDVVAAIETPSGEVRPPRQSRPGAPIGQALTKFLDAAITPFGRLASTLVDAQAIDPRQLAVDVSADAVRSVEASARSYKVEGKRPGYERVTRHKASITRLVEEALNDRDVDVASILETDE